MIDCDKNLNQIYIFDTNHMRTVVVLVSLNVSLVSIRQWITFQTVKNKNIVNHVKH